MVNRRSDTLLHPIRLRIVLAAAGDEVTTAELARRLPDVAQATLYRHIATLAESGILEAVAERRARGAVERTYRVSFQAADLSAEELAAMSDEEHLEAFTTFAGLLIDTYGRYLSTGGAQPLEDGVSYRQARIWLDDGELARLVDEIRAVLEPYQALGPGAGRAPRLLSTILMPDPVGLEVPASTSAD